LKLEWHRLPTTKQVSTLTIHIPFYFALL
jgi:hypothetical protein